MHPAKFPARLELHLWLCPKDGCYDHREIELFPLFAVSPNQQVLA
jgi:hypothetical protein